LTSVWEVFVPIDWTTAGTAGRVLGPLVLRVFRQDWRSRLLRKVRQETRSKAVGRQRMVTRWRVRRWLADPATRERLALPDQTDTSEELTAGLRDALAPRRWRWWPALPEADRHAAVGSLLPAITRDYLRVQDAGPAADVVDRRAADRHAGLAGNLKAALDVQALPERIAQLPPTCETPLTQLGQQDQVTAGRLAQLLTDSSALPAILAADLAGKPPDWLEVAPPAAWLVLAEFAAAHQDPAAAAVGFERAADAGASPRATWLARAALAAHAAGDPAKARALADGVTDPSNTLLQVTRAAIDGDLEAVIAAARNTDPADADRWLIERLAANAAALTGRLDEAIDQLETILARDEQASSAALAAARLRLQRVLGHASVRWVHDLRRARQLALLARRTRRGWRGPSDEAVAVACEASAILVDFPGVLQLGQVPPAGDAIEPEAASQQVLPWVAEAAISLGNLPLAADVIGRIRNRSVQARLGADLAAARGETAEQLRSAYQRAYELAEDDTQRLAAQQGLAGLGIWPLPGFDEVHAQDEPTADHLAALSELARGEHVAAVQRLRRWQGSSPPAARLLAEVHRQARQPDEAVAVLRRLHERTHDPRALLSAAFILDDAGRTNESEELIQEALATLPPDAADRRLIRRELIKRAAQDQRWAAVAGHVHALRAEGLVEPADRWALIGAMINQQQLDEAWQELREQPPLEPSTAQQARAWVELHHRYQHVTATVVDRALELLAHWSDDEELNEAVMQLVLVGGRDLELPEPSAARARAVVADILDRFPDRVTQFDATDLESLVAQLRPVLVERRERTTWAIRMIVEQGLPYGVLAGVTGRPYAEVLILRGAGCLPVHPADPGLASQEQAAAHAALDGPVVLDTSTLHLAALIPARWPDLIGAFTSIAFPLPAAADLLGARDLLTERSTDSLTVDATTGKLQLLEDTPERAGEFATRAAWMAERANGLDRVPHDRLTRLTDLDSDRARPMLAAVDLAASRRQPLYCDDLGLRRLAAELGVPTFGTITLLAALAAAGRLSAGAVDAAIEELALHWVVDLPIDPARLRSVAAREGWAPVPAAYPLTRPAIWQRHPEVARNFYREGCRHGSQLDVDTLVGWLQAAALGLSRTVAAPHRTIVLGRLLTGTVLDVRADPDRFSALLGGARRAATQVEASDPLPTTVRELHAAFSQGMAPDAAARQVLRLCTILSADDRQLVVRALLLTEES
jgi:tetratricopeptide (TPR) repeat protein